MRPSAHAAFARAAGVASRNVRMSRSTALFSPSSPNARAAPARSGGDGRSKLLGERGHERAIARATDERSRHVPHARVVGRERVEQRLRFGAIQRRDAHVAHELVHVGAYGEIGRVPAAAPT